MYQVEQRDDGWWVIMAGEQHAMEALFSDRETAQLIAAMRAPASQTARQRERGQQQERVTAS